MTTITDEQYPVTYDPPIIVKGADWIGTAFQLMQDDNITPLDTTGYTAEFIIYSSENGETYTTLTVGSGITHTPAQGLFNIVLTESTIDALDFKTANYKFIVTDSGGGSTPFFMGRLKIVG